MILRGTRVEARVYLRDPQHTYKIKPGEQGTVVENTDSEKMRVQFDGSARIIPVTVFEAKTISAPEPMVTEELALAVLNYIEATFIAAKGQHLGISEIGRDLLGPSQEKINNALRKGGFGAALDAIYTRYGLVVQDVIASDSE